MQHTSTHQHIFIHALVALCLIFAGLSPACHFVSGKTSFIEICKSDGSIATIEVPADFDPFADSAPHKHPPKAQKQCSFCFAQMHISQDLVHNKAVIHTQKTAFFIHKHGRNTVGVHKAVPQNQRAPPSFA